MRYYAAHQDYAVVFATRNDRDTFCVGNVFEPIEEEEFMAREWYFVNDYTEGYAHITLGEGD